MYSKSTRSKILEGTNFDKKCLECIDGICGFHSRLCYCKKCEFFNCIFEVEFPLLIDFRNSVGFGGITPPFDTNKIIDYIFPSTQFSNSQREFIKSDCQIINVIKFYINKYK